MSKYGKKHIYDITTKEYREEELTDEEKAEFDKREEEHAKQQAEYAKVKHLDDRKNDPDYPTMNETQEAMLAFMKGDTSKFEAINKRMDALIAKYPAPGESNG